MVIDHEALNRWTAKYAPLIAENARRRERICVRSWRMDETYLRFKGAWTYLYRAVYKHGKTLNFILSSRRNKAAESNIFARALNVNGLARKNVINKNSANTAGIMAIYKMLNGLIVRYRLKCSGGTSGLTSLNWITEFIKRRTRPCRGLSLSYLHPQFRTVLKSHR